MQTNLAPEYAAREEGGRPKPFCASAYIVVFAPLRARLTSYWVMS